MNAKDTSGLRGGFSAGCHHLPRFLALPGRQLPRSALNATFRARNGQTRPCRGRPNIRATRGQRAANTRFWRPLRSGGSKTEPEQDCPFRSGRPARLWRSFVHERGRNFIVSLECRSHPTRRVAACSVEALAAAPPGQIRQHEQVQTREQEHEERWQRRVGHPCGRLSLCQRDEVGDNGPGKGKRQPAVGLPNPSVSFQSNLLW